MSKYEELKNAQTSPVEHIVFSGGGPKGIAYIGAYKAMYDSGLMSDIKSIAGSSAGAMTAAAIATGMSPEKFEKLMNDTDLPKLKGKMVFKGGIYDGVPMLELLKDTMSKNILDYLDNFSPIEEAKSSLKITQEKTNELLLKIDKLNEEIVKVKEVNGDISDLESNISDSKRTLEEMNKKQDVLSTLIDNDGKELSNIRERCINEKKVTFKDLALLRNINPEKFKGLILTATRKLDGEMQIFNETNTPDLDIAEVCRASASIPVYFRHTEVEGVKYVDGGYKNNIPMEYFDQEKNKNSSAEDVTNSPTNLKDGGKKNRTLVFAFATTFDNTANVAIYSEKKNITSPGVLFKFIVDIVLKSIAKVGGYFKSSELDEQTYQNLRKNALDTVVINTAKVGTLDFERAKEESEYLNTKSYNSTMHHVQNHELGKVSVDMDYHDLVLNVYEKLTQQKQSIWSSRFTKDIGNQILKFADKSLCDDPIKAESSLKNFIEFASNSKLSSPSLANILTEVINDKFLTTDRMKTRIGSQIGIDEKSSREHIFKKTELEKVKGDSLAKVVPTKTSSLSR